MSPSGSRDRRHGPAAPLLLAALLVATAGCEELDPFIEDADDRFESITLDIRTWARIGMDEVALTDADVTVEARSYAHAITLDEQTLRARTDGSGECSILVVLKTDEADLPSHPYYRPDGYTFISMEVSARWENAVTATYRGTHRLSFDPPYPDRWTLWMWLQQDEPAVGAP